MSVTVCWSLKGGSGTSVVAAALALADPIDSLLVDLDGDAPAVLGLPEPGGQGVSDWLASDAPAAALGDLVVTVDRRTQLLPVGTTAVPRHGARWPELVTWCRAHANTVIDAGHGPPPPALVDAGARSVLVTRACYLGLRRVAACGHRPDGIVLVAEPGRRLRVADVERSVGAPVLASIPLDPAIARAVDAGLLAARLPRGVLRKLRSAA